MNGVTKLFLGVDALANQEGFESFLLARGHICLQLGFIDAFYGFTANHDEHAAMVPGEPRLDRLVESDLSL